LLEETLDEEKDADEKLSTIAGKVISDTTTEDSEESARSARSDR